MFCPQCGTEIENTVRFCPSCGTPLSAGPGAQQPHTQQPYVYPQQPVVYVKPKVPGRGFGISGMVLGIIGLVYGTIPLAAALDVLSGRWVSDYEAGQLVGVSLVYSVLSILAVCFAPAAKKRGYINSIQKAGMVTGWIGLCFYIFAVFMGLIAASL